MLLRIALFFLLFPCVMSCSQGSQIEQGLSLAVTQQQIRKDSKCLIVLDPGHGGFDIGAASSKVEEKSLALRTAILVKRYLVIMGYRVILTRSRDIFLPLKRRTTIANETKSKVLVSLHYNAFKDLKVKGIEVYYYDKGGKWRSTSSKRLAQVVLSSMLAETGAVSRGVKHGNFHIVREANMPAILIEGGFITHPYERDQLNSQKYLDRLAQGIAKGIDKYLH